VPESAKRVLVLTERHGLTERYGRAQSLEARLALSTLLASAITLCGSQSWATPASGQPAIKIEEAAGEAKPTVAAAKEAAAKLTAETIATKPKPKGFRYSIVRERFVDEVTETLLYVKKSARAKSTRAIPIPKDRSLLATCIEGGTLADLKRGSTVTARFDPKGVVRPKLTIVGKVEVETLHGKVIDIGGPKLYLVLDDGSRRGFSVGSYADWNQVVQNGSAADLKRQTALTLRFDPSGEQDLQIVLDVKPAATAPNDGGCGCSTIRSSNQSNWDAIACLLIGLVGSIRVYRSQHFGKERRPT